MGLIRNMYGIRDQKVQNSYTHMHSPHNLKGTVEEIGRLGEKRHLHFSSPRTPPN